MNSKVRKIHYAAHHQCWTPRQSGAESCGQVSRLLPTAVSTPCGLGGCYSPGMLDAPMSASQVPRSPLVHASRPALSSH